MMIKVESTTKGTLWINPKYIITIASCFSSDTLIRVTYDSGAKCDYFEIQGSLDEVKEMIFGKEGWIVEEELDWAALGRVS